MKQMKTSRPRNWLYEFWIILIGAVLIGFWWLILGSARQALAAGAWTYLILAWSTRLIFQKHHSLRGCMLTAGIMALFCVTLRIRWRSPKFLPKAGTIVMWDCPIPVSWVKWGYVWRNMPNIFRNTAPF